MRIDQLEMANFCQHSYRSYDFQAGLTGVVGPVGSGKSNLIGAVKFALTGDSPNAGTLAENIRQTAGADEASFVRVRFSHAGVVADLTRALRPTPSAVLRRDGEVIRGDKKIAAWLDDMLKLPKGVLQNIVFAAQADTFGFLAEQPAKRLELFQRLFAADRAERVYDGIGKYLALRPNVLGLDLVRLQTQIADLATQIDRLTTELNACRPKETIAAELAAARHRLASYKAYAQLSVAFAQAQQQLVPKQAELDQRHAAFNAAQALLQQYEDQMTAQTEAYNEAREALTQGSLYQEVSKRRTVLEAELRAAEARLAALTEPVKPDDYLPDDERQAQVLVAKTEHEKAEQFIATFTAAGVAECPTCGTPTANLAAQLTEAQAKRLDRQTVLFAARQRLTTSMAYDANCVSHRMAAENETRNITQLRYSLEQNPLPAQPTREGVDAQRVVTAYGEFVKGRESAMASQRIASSAEQAARNELLRYEQRVTELTGQLQTYQDVVGSDEAQLTGQIGMLETEQQQRERLALDLGPLMGNLEAMQRQYVDAERVAKESDKRARWEERLTKIREVFHRGGAPLRVVTRTLSELSSGINDCLRMFQADYTISVTDTADFIATFGDGRQQPATRLSCGQRVLLVLAWRIALNCVFAEHLGLLVLDEPTAFLDDQLIRGFEPALNRLREFSTARGLQVFLITHERTLTPLFDTVIDLAGSRHH